MQENDALNAVLEKYAAETFASLSSMDRVHCFWSCTTMEQDEFREMLLKLLNSKVIDVYNDFTPEFIRAVLGSFVKYSAPISKKNDNSSADAQKSWCKVCKEIAEINVQNFLNGRNADENNRVIEQFSADLEPFFRDEELAIFLLLNFARSVARNEFVQTPAEKVNFKSGITKRIWKNAAQKYFPKEYVV